MHQRQQQQQQQRRQQQQQQQRRQHWQTAAAALHRGAVMQSGLAFLPAASSWLTGAFCVQQQCWERHLEVACIEAARCRQDGQKQSAGGPAICASGRQQHQQYQLRLLQRQAYGLKRQLCWQQHEIAGVVLQQAMMMQ
jgi:hypothetical protein